MTAAQNAKRPDPFGPGRFCAMGWATPAGADLAALFDDLNQMRQLVDHATHRGGILELAGLVHLVEAQTDEGLTLILRAADRAADLLDDDGFCHLSGSLRFCRFSNRRFVTLFQDVSHLLATALRHHTRAGLFAETIERGADHVIGVLRPGRFRDHVLNAQHLEHGAHRTTGDDAGTMRSCAHHDFAGAMATFHVVVQGAALAQRHADHCALGSFGGLADRLGNFLGFTFAKADAALLIAHDHQRREAKALTALDCLGHTVDRDETIGELRGFLAFATVAAVVFSCHSLVSLNLQASFTRGVGNCLDTPVKQKAAPIEIGLGDAGLLGPLGNRGANLGGRLDIALAHQAQILFEGRGRRERHTVDVVDQLHADVLVGAENAQAHAPCIDLAEFVPNAQAAFEEQFSFAVCHLSRPYFFLPSFWKMYSPL
ncbi:conserved hypothetical protein [Roseovarius sp. EC-HK134]|nr:conserved hypothetical protein [Roseovarius sp. EC-HK134]